MILSEKGKEILEETPVIYKATVKISAGARKALKALKGNKETQHIAKKAETLMEEIRKKGLGVITDPKNAIKTNLQYKRIRRSQRVLVRPDWHIPHGFYNG